MRKVLLFILMYIIWLFLTWPFSPMNIQDIIAGIIVAFAVILFLQKQPEGETKNYFELQRYFWGVIYIPVLIFYMIIANFDVLYRVLHPDMPIKPGIVKIKTQLSSSIARAILCNSITLTPGTLSVDIIDDTIYVHWINISEDKIAGCTEKIAGKFEKILKRIFE